ncbi:FAD-dependent monooxygenase [Xenorhabdus sp. XENO-7]|uniref:FAD-dependent monooxygenase n=1 Tax=Xenorhabdus aichiensis TaxID=3025874 RepID=A0ABT5M5B5_9GAMM|nr:FAD-dependent monooxygenase [Xenorhabdus aichiensis]MDC9622880.1 FAD-dependent monooxygenase [Xenorhabdus aichiensis]
MKIQCIGAGPAGLVFSILAKMQDHNRDVVVYERNLSNVTTGWGLVLSEPMLQQLANIDPSIVEQLRPHISTLNHIDIHIKEKTYRSSGYQFLAISRLEMINTLRKKALDLGIKINYDSSLNAEDLINFPADLTVISDGANSKIRHQLKDEFDTDIDEGKNLYLWLGTSHLFNDTFNFIFEQTETGWFWAHCYKFENDHSTFVVECTHETWAKTGFAHMDEKQTIAFLEKVFHRHLCGHPLQINDTCREKAYWRRFVTPISKHWSHDKKVLLGNAAHSAHFSIGSGTKLAIGDAIALAENLKSSNKLDSACFTDYQHNRQDESSNLHIAAQNSQSWFENVESLIENDPLEFSISLLLRSGRLSRDELTINLLE